MSVAEGFTADFPVLSDEQISAVARRGTRHETRAGEVLYRAGDRGYDFIVIEAGEVDVVRPAMPDAAETLIATWGAGRFLGELNLITGQTAVATARVRTPGLVHRVAPQQFRELMAADGDLSDLILRVLLARRESLRRGDGARVLEILGSQISPAPTPCAYGRPGRSCHIRGLTSTTPPAKHSRAPRASTSSTSPS